MALKAGYVGVKKSVLSFINNLVGSKIIKTIGDGLSLTNAGKLNLTAATASKIGGVKVGDGLAIENGVLNVTATGSDYSTNEVNTGIKWIDGKDIYMKVLTYETVPATGTQLMTGINEVIQSYGSQYWAQGNLRTNYPRENLRYEVKINDHTVVLSRTESAVVTDAKYVFFYTKYEEEG